MNKSQSSDLMTLARQNCAAIRDSKVCQDVYQQIAAAGNTVADYALSCTDDEIKKSMQTQALKKIAACFAGVYDAPVGDFIHNMQTRVSDLLFDKLYCDKSLVLKKLLYTAHNASEPDDLKVIVPTDAALNGNSCYTLRRNIYYQDIYQNIHDRLWRGDPVSYEAASATDLLHYSEKMLSEKIHIRSECYEPVKAWEMRCRFSTYAIETAAPIAAYAAIRVMAGIAKAAEVAEAATKTAGAATAGSAVTNSTVLGVTEATSWARPVGTWTQPTEEVAAGSATEANANSGNGTPRASGEPLEPGAQAPLPQGGKPYVAQPASPPKTEEVVAAFERNTGRKVRLDFNGTTGAVVDAQTGERIFTFDAKVHWSTENNEYYVKEVSSGAAHDFYSLLMNRFLNAHPKVKFVRANLAHGNLKALNDQIKGGYSVVEAIKATPSFRVYAENGFTKIDVGSVKYSYNSKGLITSIQYDVSKPQP